MLYYIEKGEFALLSENCVKKSAGEKGRSEGYDYERQLVDAFNNIIPGIATEAQQSVLSKFERRTISKADINVAGQPVSIKNPGRSSSSIQIMVTAAENFFLSLGVSPETMNAFNLFFGLGDGFSNLLEENSIDRHTLDWDSESRRQRLKYGSLPQDSQDSLLSFLSKNKREIVEVVFSHGWAKDSEYHASKMIWCNSSVSGKSNVDNLCLFDMEEVIDKICQYEWSVRPSDTVVELGPLTLQMKGSGKGKSYHYPQFNTSLNDLRKFGINCVEGDYKQILETIAGSN